MSSENEPSRLVMIVEDEPRLRTMLLRAVPDMGYEGVAAESGEDALRKMDQRPADIVILDLNLPGIGGMEVFEQIRQRWNQTSVIIMTGYGDLASARQAIRLDVVDFLTKPTSLGELEVALDRAWRRRLDLLRDRKRLAAPAIGNLMDEPVAQEEAAPARPSAAAPAPAGSAHNLRDLERQAIEQALERHEGNRAAAAAELGISVRTLYYRLREYETLDRHQDGAD